MADNAMRAAAAGAAMYPAGYTAKPVRVAVRRAASPAVTHPPLATFRLQFRPGFGFAQARALVPFLRRLGITDLYASPLFQARTGSSHGYDVTSPLRLNPELGTEQQFEALVGELKRHGMGLVLDFVPNHMAATAENPWWRDVLEDGPASCFAAFFDIDWEASPPGTRGKILAPVLGGPYGAALENRELQIALDDQGFSARYYEHVLPLALPSYTSLLRLRFDAWKSQVGAGNPLAAAVSELLRGIERLARCRGNCRIAAKQALKLRLWQLYREETEIRALVDGNLALLNGTRGDPESFDLLDGVLAAQHYRLACWREASERVNYRRFFDINELVSVRIEDEEVFGATHSFLFRLIREGKITGIRLDHIDGLHDPAGYLERLDDCLAPLKPRRVYVAAEKILLGAERLPESWPVDGTTGYDFINAVNAVFVDAPGLERLDAVYRRFSGVALTFKELVCEQKKRVMDQLFRGELNRLCARLEALAARTRHHRDCSAEELRSALREVTARLPVYRTYARALSLSPHDRSTLQAALDSARDRLPATSAPALDFLSRVLLLDFPDSCPPGEREEWLRFLMRWQQFTGPVMAKGAEDTACYIYNRLISLNVVGGGSRPVSVQEFHRFNCERRLACPHTLNATSTHDSKRSEDVRARINVLSELPELWEGCLLRWSEWNRPKKRLVGGSPAPDANEEILIYQVLLGAWPLDQDEVSAFKERMSAFLIKAAREAKIHTSWIAQDAAYEQALVEFLWDILDPGAGNRFLEDFLQVQARIAPFGAAGSLGQVLLKIACPGVPDFYQGTLLWDFSLVDPDNRRPVDFARRVELLEQLEALEGEDPIPLVSHLVENWADGRIKLYVISKALELRRSASELFRHGEYLPLRAGGEAGEHVVAFARREADRWVIAAVPRALAKLCRGRGSFTAPGMWDGTSLELPQGAPTRWRNAFTGEIVRATGRDTIELASAFRHLPVLLLASW